MSEPQLNFSLLYELAARHEKKSFVFVGPVAALGSQREKYELFRELPNVYFLGEKDVDDLPAYCNHFDISTMCYNIDDYTKYIYPLKLHEYLATGKPVIATPIDSLLEFEGTISLGNDVNEWTLAIEKLLQDDENSKDKVDQRRLIASQYDWDILVKKITGVICQRFGLEDMDELSIL